MNSFLKEIIQLKTARLNIAKAQISFEEIKERAFFVRKNAEPQRLRLALSESDKINIIAEIKRASPSKGIINDRIAPAELARKYEISGACAISVLTEEDKFLGSLQDLRNVRQSVALPILRKDFVLDEFQIYESAEAGADVILLIAAMLDDEKLSEFHHLAEEVLGLDALIEVHTSEELERAKNIGAKLIGVNNRDLNTFRVSLDVSRELIRDAPKDAFLISESGLKTPDDLTELKNLGYRGFLIGETLMKSENVESALKDLGSVDILKQSNNLNE